MLHFFYKSCSRHITRAYYGTVFSNFTHRVVINLRWILKCQSVMRKPALVCAQPHARLITELLLVERLRGVDGGLRNTWCKIPLVTALI